jgi:hypothetical protein
MFENSLEVSYLSLKSLDMAYIKSETVRIVENVKNL